jgi:hypothetical protein
VPAPDHGGPLFSNGLGLGQLFDFVMDMDAVPDPESIALYSRPLQPGLEVGLPVRVAAADPVCESTESDGEDSESSP